MKNKSIKNSLKILMKVVMISGIVVIFNIVNIVNCFASDSFHISKATIDDSGDTIIKYSDDSWYSYNNSTNKYIFKSAKSNKELSFNSIFDMDDSIAEYSKNKSILPLLKDNTITIGFEKHSDNIYIDDLKTDEKLKIYTEHWLKDNYNLTLNIPVYYCKLDDSTQGKFVYKDKTPQCIQINEDLKGMDMIVEKILIHEATHMSLFEMRKDFDDGTEDFSKECVKNGSNTNDGEIGFLQSHLQCTL